MRKMQGMRGARHRKRKVGPICGARRFWLRGPLVLVCFLELPELRAQDVLPEQAPIPIQFEYEAPAECLDEDQAFSLVERRSRRVRLSEGDNTAQTLSMRVEALGSEFRGVLTVRRAEAPEERRTMVGAECSEVVEALALTAALSIDPNATLTLGDPEEPASERPESRPPAKLAQPKKASRPEPASPREVVPNKQPSHETYVGVGVSAAVQRVMENSIHIGPGAVFFLSRRDGRRFLPLEARLSVQGLFEPNVVEPSVRTPLFLSQVSYCPLRIGERQAVALCPFVQLGAIAARPVGFADQTSVTRFFSSAGLEAWLRGHVTEKLQMWVAPGAIFPLTRRQFAVAPGPEVLARTVDVGFSVSSGVGYVF